MLIAPRQQSANISMQGTERVPNAVGRRARAARAKRIVGGGEEEGGGEGRKSEKGSERTWGNATKPTSDFINVSQDSHARHHLGN